MLKTKTFWSGIASIATGAGAGKVVDAIPFLNQVN